MYVIKIGKHTTEIAGLLNGLIRRSLCSAAPKRHGSSSPLVISETHSNGQIHRLILNDPKKRNALSLAMLSTLWSEFTKSLKQTDCRVIILAGTPPMFSSGHDLKELTADTGRQYHARVFSKCVELMKLIQDCDVPIVAEVNGMAAAAGCQLAASCDIVVAADNCRFSTPGISVGLFCSTPGVALSRAVPRKLASYMMLTGESIDAQTALAGGLVSLVVPSGDLEQKTMHLAQRLAGLSRPSLALGKRFFYAQIERDRNYAYKLGEEVMLENLRLADCQEGIQAFKDKRPANWTHSDKRVF